MLLVEVADHVETLARRIMKHCPDPAQAAACSISSLESRYHPASNEPAVSIMLSLTFTADDGESLHVWRHGEQGPAVVFLHGWTASHLEWSPFVHELAQHHRVFRWDARAHGGHAPLTGNGATAARMARDLDNMIDALQLHGACFVGHSMGALTLWQYVRDCGTAKIGSLCFIDQSPKLMTDASWQLGIYGDFDKRRSAALLANLREDFAEGVLRLAAYGLNDLARAGYDANSRGWQKLREALRTLRPEPLISCWEDLVRLDLREVMPCIDRPTLLVHGGASNFYPIEIAHWLMARLPQARLSIHEDANHSPHLMDPRRFLDELGVLLAESAQLLPTAGVQGRTLGL
jgi:pimeloyl-ACP methyl ester carboxylesterase